VRTTNQQVALPIGRTARLAYQVDALRADCSQAARDLVNEKTLDEATLEDCARLDEALARAQRILKCAVRDVMLSRLSRTTGMGH
jgi:hypothetical protein